MDEVRYPDRWLEQMKALLGNDFSDFMEALATPPVTSLRLNPGKPGAVFAESEPVPWCSEGHFLAERPRFVRDPLLHAGAYYVQESSSMLIGAAVPLKEGMKVLDLCAAPGGKSTLLAARIGADGLLVSNEIVGSRARVLEENISRWGAPNVVVTHNRSDDFKPLKHFFDLILVDAPCSGEGMFRKDPEVISHWSPKAIDICAERQKEILENILPVLKPGGQLIYSTCTYNRQENEDIVQWVLDTYEDSMGIVPWQPPAEWGLTPGATEGYHPDLAFTYHAYPHQFKGEGFYLAVLKKEGGVAGRSKVTKKARRPRKGGKGPTKEISAKAIRVAETFLADKESVHLHKSEDELEAWPLAWKTEIEALKTYLSIYKAGIRLGKGNRDQFIPDHDFAMSPLLNEAVPVKELTYENAIQFLKRGALELETYEPKGWVIARYKGVNLGWMKILANRVNIHLPKQWRIRADISNW